MSLLRWAVRLAAIRALETRAALAGVMVLDTFAGALDRVGEEPVPVVVVTTEDHKVERERNRYPDKVEIDLLFEVSLVSLAADEHGPALGYAASSPEAEATLDLIESEIDRALAEDHLFRSLSFSHDWTSTPVRDETTAQRITVRACVASCKLHPACAAPVRLLGQAEPTGLARLPEAVRAVAEAIPPGHWAEPIVAKIAAARPVLTYPTPLTSVGLTLAPGGEGAPVIEADADTTA